MRTPDIQAFARTGAMWNHDTDIKVNDTLLASGLRERGHPLHDLRLHTSAITEKPIPPDTCHASRTRGRSRARVLPTLGGSRRDSPGAARL